VSDQHPEHEPVTQRQSDDTPEKKPGQSASSADGGTCAAWVVIGCLGIALTVALLAFIGGIIYLVSQSDDRPATSTPTPGAVSDSGSQPDPADDDAAFEDGILTVGDDIEPGIYFADQAEEFCYWERLSGFSGEFEDIITNQLVDDRAIVEILESDAGFSSELCGEWRSAPGEIRPNPSAPFAGGTFLVGDEIEPGAWQSEGGEDYCYWVRLSGFSGELHDIVTNSFGELEPVVEISPDDTGFHSVDCGTWTRVDD
jgi:hypothetical protein